MANENKDFIKLDDIDVSILKIINEDVRTSYRQISRSLDVSVGTVGIYDVTGEYDAFLIAKFKDTNELNTFIKDLVKDPNIERTYTQTVLDVIKEDSILIKSY